MMRKRFSLTKNINSIAFEIQFPQLSINEIIFFFHIFNLHTEKKMK